MDCGRWYAHIRWNIIHPSKGRHPVTGFGTGQSCGHQAGEVRQVQRTERQGSAIGCPAMASDPETRNPWLSRGRGWSCYLMNAIPVLKDKDVLARAGNGGCRCECS